MDWDDEELTDDELDRMYLKMNYRFRWYEVMHMVEDTKFTEKGFDEWWDSCKELEQETLVAEFLAKFKD